MTALMTPPNLGSFATAIALAPQTMNKLTRTRFNMTFLSFGKYTHDVGLAQASAELACKNGACFRGLSWVPDDMLRGQPVPRSLSGSRTFAAAPAAWSPARCRRRARLAAGRRST